MRKSLLIATALVLSVYGCSSDESGTTSPEEVEDMPLAADTIGTGGGTFDAAGFQLVIPPGAFSTDTELLLYESSEEHGFGDGCISDFFRLAGLPASFAESLTVRLEYEGTPGSDILIAVGEMTTFHDEDSDSAAAPAFDFYPATETSGYLEAVIPASEPIASLKQAPPAKAGSSKDKHLAALKDVRLRGHSEHVSITYPIYLCEHMDEIAGYFEAGHDSVVSIGMGYENRFWKWPLQVTVRDVSEGSIPVLIPARFSLSPSKGFRVDIHEPFIAADNLPWLRYFLGNVMVVAAQYIPSEAEYSNADHYPWNCAVAAWVGCYWPPPGYSGQPKNLGGNEMRPLLGLPVSGLSNGGSGGSGGAWSPVVKYLADREGRALVGNVYRATQTTDEKPIPDLMERVHPAYEWWPQFVHQYVTGQIYNVETSVLLSQISEYDKRTIASASDTLTLFSRTAHQLSAGMYRIILDYALIDEGAAMQVEGSADDVDMDWFTLLVYKVKDGVLEHIASGDTVTVIGLRDLTIEGYDIVIIDALSYNDEPYTESFTTGVTSRIVNPLPYTECRIHVGYTGKWQFGDDDPYWDYISPSWYADGSFTGNTFTGEIAQWHHGGNTTGSVTVTIDRETMTVTSFSAGAVTVDEWGTSSWGITGASLPRTSYIPGYSLGSLVEGTATCYYITSLQWSYVPVTGDSQVLVDYACDESAGLELILSAY